jgi:hypothetical protein
MGTEKGQPAREPRPDPEWVRGACPRCGEELVSSCYYVSGRGYLVLWECWASLRSDPTCDYRRVL